MCVKNLRKAVTENVVCLCSAKCIVRDTLSWQMLSRKVVLAPSLDWRWTCSQCVCDYVGCRTDAEAEKTGRASHVQWHDRCLLRRRRRLTSDRLRWTVMCTSFTLQRITVPTSVSLSVILRFRWGLRGETWFVAQSHAADYLVVSWSVGVPLISFCIANEKGKVDNEHPFFIFHGQWKMKNGG